MFKLFIVMFTLVALTNGEYYYENNQKIELVRIEETRGGGENSEVRFKNSSGRIFTLKNGIIIKYKDRDKFDGVLNNYSVKIEEDLGSGYLLLKVDDDCDLFEICRKLHNEPSVEIAHPNFKRERRAR